MDDSNLPDFIPASLRARHDGWTPERQRAFIGWLHKGLRPVRAAERVGMSRKSAYALRARAGAESFAAAWDAADEVVRARRAALHGPTSWERAVEGMLHPIRHRGRITAWERRYDNRALIRLLGQLDRFID